MAVCKYVVLFWAVLLAAAVVAGPDRTRVELAVGDDGGKQAFRFDSDDNVVIDGNEFDRPPDICAKDSREMHIARKPLDVAG